MTILEKITANMELTELKKFKLQKAILTLMLEWKHLEEYMDSTQQSFQECFEQLQHKEEHLDSVQKSAMASNKKLESVRGSIEKRMKQLGDKERIFDAQVRELGLKEKRLVLIERSIEERIEEVELREEKLKGVFEEFKVEEMRLEDIRESVGERIGEINSKEMQLDKRIKEFECREEEFNAFCDERVGELDLKEKQLGLIEESVEERNKEIELREDKVKLMFEEFKVKEKQFEEIQESVWERFDEITSKETQLDKRIKELECKEEEFNAFRDERVSELDLKEKHLGLIGESVEERNKEIELREEKVKLMFEEIDEINSKKMKLDERSQELDDLQDQIERRVKKLNAKDEDIEKRLKEVEWKEKEYSERAREIELEKIPVNSSTDVEFWSKIDGKGLQLFLNQREKDHNSMSEEIYRALQMSPDPAKLVLDAMEGFYPKDPNKGKTEFTLDVIRRSCILLLEQLMRISPQVRPHVKEKAMELVCQWKVKLNAVPDSMEVLGHMYLLAAYCLPIPFRTDEFLGLVEIVAEHRQAPKLCRLIGFTDRISDLVRNLLRKNHTLLAVRFVSEFGLVDKFPPHILLKGFKVKGLIKMAKRSSSCKVQQNAYIDKKVAAMQEIINYIIDHKLESRYSPKGFELYIEQLLSLKEDNNGTVSKPIEHKKIKKKYLSKAPISSKSDLIELNSLANMAFVLANMDGRTLQLFLNEHFEDHELMRDVVLLALEHLSNPGRLVLDAMGGFHLPNRKVGVDHFEVNVVRSSCILLLEQLMRIQIHLQPQMKGEAMVIAHHLESNMRDEIENPQVILGFFQFIGAFGLTSCFDRDELFRLFEKIASHPHARGVCKVLGFSENKPGCVQHPRVISEGSSSKSVPLNRAVGFVNVSPAHDSKALGVDGDGKSEIPIFHHVSDPAKLILDAIRGCYNSNFKKWDDLSKSKIMENISSLLEQLLEASPEIKSRVQDEAMAFSVDWKSKLSVSRNNQAEVKAFSRLLVTYKLGSSITFEELLGLLDPIREYKQKFELYRLLDFTHKTPDFIRYLIGKEQRLFAIRFIDEFELVEQFPPAPILKSHLRYIEKQCTKICEGGDYSSEALDNAAYKEAAFLKAVISCLKILKIDCDCTPGNLEVRVNQIMKQMEDKKVLLRPAGSTVEKKQELDMKKRANDFEVETQEQNAKKRPRLTPPVPSVQNVVPTALHEAYPVNPNHAPPNSRGLSVGQQGRPNIPWQYGHGGMNPLGWQYRPNTGAFHGLPNNMILRPSAPYLYRPWQ